LNEEESSRLNALRLPLIVGVVFIHSYETVVNVSGQALGLADANFFTDFVRNLVSQGVARTSVPLFFLLAGYFLYFNTYCSKQSYVDRLISRSRTLLLPFLFWGIFTFGLYFLAQILPLTRSYFSGARVSVLDYSPYDFFAGLLGIGRPPLAYHLWFLRDLLLLVIVSPLICFFVRYSPFFYIGAVLIVWYSGVNWFSIPSSEALLFFSFGVFLSFRRLTPFIFDRGGVVLFAGYLVFLVVDAASPDFQFKDHFHRFTVLIGVFVVLWCSRFFVKYAEVKKILLWSAPGSYFVYLAHEPLLMTIRKIAYRLFRPSAELEVLALYLFVPFFVVGLLLFVWFCLRRILPSSLSNIVGVR